MTSIIASMQEGKTYFLRVRHNGTKYGSSNWSTTVRVSTLVPVSKLVGKFYGALHIESNGGGTLWWDAKNLRITGHKRYTSDSSYRFKGFTLGLNSEELALFRQARSVAFTARVSASYGAPAYSISAQPNSNFIMGISTYEYSSWSGGTSNLYIAAIS